jgi:hypothetical protein
VEGDLGHREAGHGRPMAPRPLEVRAKTQGPVTTANGPFFADVAGAGDTESDTTRKVRVCVDSGSAEGGTGGELGEATRARSRLMAGWRGRRTQGLVSEWLPKADMKEYREGDRQTGTGRLFIGFYCLLFDRL